MMNRTIKEKTATAVFQVSMIELRSCVVPLFSLLFCEGAGGDISWSLTAVSKEQTTSFCDKVHQAGLVFGWFCCHNSLPLLRKEMEGVV